MNTKMITRFLVSLKYVMSVGVVLYPLTLNPPLSCAEPAEEGSTELLIDAVVASVNGKPITLQELSSHLPTPRKLTLKEASLDPEVRETLEHLVMQRLIEEDAASKRIGVGDGEVDAYIDEVARRNELTRENFIVALKEQGRSFDQYKEQIKNDILRSKLTAQYVQGSVTVSKEEIDKYLEAHPKMSKSGSKFQLAQILVATDNRTDDEVTARIKTIEEEIAKEKEFSAIAMQYSDGPSAKEGGSLGVVAEQDLSPAIFDALFSLSDGQVTKPIPTSVGIVIFKVEKRFVEQNEEAHASLVNEVKSMLRQQKTEAKMMSYFNTELPKLYAVEKKI